VGTVNIDIDAEARELAVQAFQISRGDQSGGGKALAVHRPLETEYFGHGDHRVGPRIFPPDMPQQVGPPCGVHPGYLAFRY
jgi:hypothetical protein